MDQEMEQMVEEMKKSPELLKEVFEVDFHLFVAFTADTMKSVGLEPNEDDTFNEFCLGNMNELHEEFRYLKRFHKMFLETDHIMTSLFDSSQVNYIQ